jgi:hypothetical protein
MRKAVLLKVDQVVAIEDKELVHQLTKLLLKIH